MAYINGIDETGGGIVESVSDGLSLSDLGVLTAEVTQSELDAKQNIINPDGAVTDKAVVFNNSGDLAAVDGVSATEVGYLSQVTSDIQSQLNAKQATITAGTNLSFSGTTLNASSSAPTITASRVCVSDTNGNLTASAVSTTDLNLLEGINSSTSSGVVVGVKKIDHHQQLQKVMILELLEMMVVHLQFLIQYLPIQVLQQV